MAKGVVREMQARVDVVFRLSGRPDLAIECVVDTGFAGALTLSPDAIAALGLPFFQLIDANLANDADVCAATIARRDDFDDRMTQCIAEMAVCRDNNVRDGHDLEVHGIVSNGQVWVFYKLTRTPEVFVSGAYTMTDMPKLLGALDHVIAACADNIPA